MTQSYTCPNCGHTQDIQVDPSLTTKDVTCSACHNLTQIVVSNKCRLAGSCVAWVDTLELVGFFLGTRESMIFHKTFNAGRIKMTTQPQDISRFAKLLKGVQSGQEEEAEETEATV